MADKKVIHKRSNVINADGSPKLPTAEQIDYGEIAINYGDGGEVISIKNSDNDIVPFIPKKAFVEAPIITDGEYMLGIKDGKLCLYKPNYVGYTFQLSAITSSSTSLNLQLGWQYVNGTNIAQPFILNGEFYNANISNYWTNETTEHNYNIIAETIVGDEYVFFANTYNYSYYITSANIISNLPMINLAYAFNNCRNLTSINSGVMNITNLTNTFDYCTNLTSLSGLAYWNVSHVNRMDDIFCYCNRLTSLDGLTNWNTSNVTNFSNLFYYCNYLTNISGIENWNTSNVTNLANSFYACTNLPNLSAIANWDVSNVTNMRNTFASCWGLKDLTGIANWNVSNVLNLENTFPGCTNLSNLDGIANWDVSNVTDLYQTFYLCSNLTSINGLANWNVCNVTNMSSTFYNCNNLTNVQGILDAFSNSRTANTTFVNGFRNCKNIQGDITIGFNYINNATNMFYGANNYLKNIYAYENTTTWNSLTARMTFNSSLNCYENTSWNARLYPLED